MKAGRHNIPLDTGPTPNQCPVTITLRDDDGRDIWTVPCVLDEHPALIQHTFHFEWNDFFSDKPLLPDPKMHLHLHSAKDRP